MEPITRILSKPASYYEEAMRGVHKLGLSNQTFARDDLWMHLFWCRYIYDTPQSKISRYEKSHSHSFLEFQCIVSGSYAYCELNREPVHLSAGDFVLISPHIEHHLLQLSAESEIFAIAFSLTSHDISEQERLHAILSSEKSLIAPMTGAMIQLTELIWEEYYNTSYLCAHTAKSYIMALASHMLRLFPTRSSQEQRSEIQIKPRLADIKKYIADNSDLIFSVSDVAKHLHLSTRQLCNIIQNEYHMTPKVFIDDIKIGQATTTEFLQN